LDKLNRGGVVSEQDPATPAPKKKRRRKNPKRRLVKRLAILRAKAATSVDLTQEGAWSNHWLAKNAKDEISHLKNQYLHLNKWLELFSDDLTPEDIDARLRKLGLVLGEWGWRLVPRE
jgi:hypothetical protein